MGDEPTAMTPDPSEKAVFAEALLRDTPEARAAYLEGACGTDIALRRRVEALLRAAENAGGFLEEPPTGLVNDSSAASASEISENPGDRIGCYKLLEKIGEGEALRRAREAEAILRVGLKTPPTGERAWQLAEMKGRLGRALVVAAMSDVTLEPALRLNSLAEVESLLLESEEQLQREPGAQWRLKLASFDMAQARMKADALQPKPTE